MKTAAISNALLHEGREYSTEILKGLTAGVSHFHAVAYIKDHLAQNGFVQVHEQDKWNLEGGKSYFYTRNQSSIVAFTLGKKCNAGVDLFKIVGCHTDSPVLKLAPFTKIDNKCGF